MRIKKNIVKNKENVTIKFGEFIIESGQSIEVYPHEAKLLGDRYPFLVILETEVDVNPPAKEIPKVEEQKENKKEEEKPKAPKKKK